MEKLGSFLVTRVPAFDARHVTLSSLISIVTQDIGFLVRRSRLLGFAVNRDTTVWIGPTTPEAVLQDYLCIFCKACMKEANQFVGLDTQANYQKLLGDLGAERGLFCSMERFECLCLQALLCPSGKRH